MNKLRETFCENLDKWQKVHFKGTRTELGEYLKVSQGQISNILAGRKCGDEAWRRMVAAKIGMDYDTMIGIEKPSNNNVIHFNDAYDKKHYEVTKNFIQKELAIEINEHLVEAESYDLEELEEFNDSIKRRLNRLRKKHKKKRPPKNDNADDQAAASDI